MMEFEFGDYIWQQDDEGNWTYKQKPKTNGAPRLATNAKYKDAPRYQVVIDYEKQVKNQFLHNVTDMIKDISKKVVTFKT